MLTIRNLQVEYKKEFPVLKGIDLSMESGKIHGLVGLNGAGKTTLLNTLYSFIRPSAGSVSYNDRSLKRLDIAYLEAENYFYPYMTGREYLDLFPAGKNGFKTDNWQQLFHIPLDDITENYSTGMRKKLALLAILKLDKPIVVLDEPFNKTVLVTSHVFETLTSCCDYIHHIDHGTIDHSYSKDQFEMLQKRLYSTIEDQASDQIKRLI